MSSLWETPIVADGDHKAGDIAQVRIQTEQPDTAAIRERWAPVSEMIAMCDALDAACAEMEEMADHCNDNADKAEEWFDKAQERLARAVTAEAELAASERWRHDTAIERDYEVGRRIAAEARGAEVYDQLQDARRRIAAALAIHKRVELGDYLDGSPMPDVCLACQENNVAGKKLWPCPTVRALTEGTDQ